MIRNASLLLALAALSILSSSCGCKRPIQPPKLPKQPEFTELPAAAQQPAEIPVKRTK
ncbi:MAG TPA: hypothetical protein VFY13_00060 [Luteolibacter sp.]|nr:hypothetical protein [Luteolibacter sp.]